MAHDNAALVAPVTIPKTATALKRHELAGHGYSSEGLYRMVQATLKRLHDAFAQATGEDGGVPSLTDLAQLANTTPHAFRHTFGTLAVAGGMALDVVQGILGHASAATTAIYVRAKEKRQQEEAEKYYANKGLPG